ncbi:MAG TPA: hypothetical protein DCE23_08920 [Firmicutes bacterium]|nr:hypothetical protein [Bacillota bacterium]
MDDKLKIFWNLEVLVKMSRSKNDGPSLRIEELEIETKIKNYRQEIEEIQSISEEENYDTSAEMADRNIEIITKKQIQVLRNELKEKNRELNDLKSEEKILYEKTNLLRENKNSQEKYIESMQERVGELVNIEVLDRYNGLIAETTEKVNQLSDDLEKESSSYNQVQEDIVTLTEKISKIEAEIAKKKELLSETQAHLENKENYIDKTKTEKNNKKIIDLESKIKKLNSRLEVLRQDSHYLETKIKDIINNKESKKKTKPYLVDLINQVISIPYINVPTDNLLEEELLRATQARDSFANEIDQKTYNILEADTPEKIRIEFLTERINKWKQQLEEYNRQIAEVDNDEQFNYERKEKILNVMIASMKKDVVEFERAYEDIPESNMGAKASLKAALDEKKEDLIEAEKISTLFRKDEADDISNATKTIKYECDQINKKIIQANDEIQKITNRLTSKKSGLIDISSRNKDKDILKELAQIVIDIKHRRQFPETPIEIVNRLEEDLGIDLKDSIDMNTIEETSRIIPKDYDEYYTKNSYNIDEPVSIYEEEPENTNEYDDSKRVDEFNEAYNKLIDDEEDESSADDSNFAMSPDIEEPEPTEDDMINRNIDDFYNSNTFIQDRYDEPYQEVEEPYQDNQEQYQEVEEPTIEESDTSDIEQQSSSELTEYEPELQENPFSETPSPIEETPEEPIIPEVQEEVYEQPVDLYNNEIIPPEGEYSDTQQQEYQEEPIIEEDNNEIDLQPEENIIEPNPEEYTEPPFVETEDQPSFEEQSSIEDQPVEDQPEFVENSPLEEQPQYIESESIDNQNQFIETNPTEEQNQYVETQPEEIAPAEEQVTEQNEVEQIEPEISENTEDQQEYQDIPTNDEYINISELIPDSQSEEVMSPIDNQEEYIELSSDKAQEDESSTPVVEEQPLPETDYSQNYQVTEEPEQNITENIDTTNQNSDNIFSSENLENELDEYISSLEDKTS